MPSSTLCTWRSFISLLFLTPFQIYLIYKSINNYLILKNAINNLPYFSEHPWIQYIPNLQLFSAIVALGIMPLWICSLILTSSSFSNFKRASFTKEGFYEIVCKEVNRISKSFQEYDDYNSRKIDKINCIIYYPLAELLYVISAVALIIPVPFIDAWLIIKYDLSKDISLDTSFSFLLDPGLNFQIKVTGEHLNLMISLIVFALQYPYLFWDTNRMFTVIFAILQLLTISNILLDGSLSMLYIKSYFLNQKKMSAIFYQPYFVIALSTVNNICLIFLMMMNFQIAYLKCVESVTNLSIALNIYTPSITNETIMSTIKSRSRNIYSAISSSDIESSRRSTRMNIQTNYGLFFISLLIILMDAMFVAVRFYYGRKVQWYSMKILSIYFIHSTVVVVIYIMYWIGTFFKKYWIFAITTQYMRPWDNSILKQLELNSYRTLQSNHNNSLSSFSNANLSLRSNPIDHTMRVSSDRSYNSLNYLKMPHSYSFDRATALSMQQSPQNFDMHQYQQQQQQQQLNRLYKTVYSCTSPKPTKLNERSNGGADSPMVNNNFVLHKPLLVKSSTENNSNNNNNNNNNNNVTSKYDNSYFSRGAASSSTPHTIQEEDSSVVTDDQEDSISQPNSPETQNRLSGGVSGGGSRPTSGLNSKFVTFQLDSSMAKFFPPNSQFNSSSSNSNNSNGHSNSNSNKNDNPSNATVDPMFSPDTSDDNLTVVSLEPVPNFLNELEESSSAFRKNPSMTSTNYSMGSEFNPNSLAFLTGSSNKASQV